MRLIIGMALLVAALAVQADNHEDQEKLYVYVTYSNCDITGEEGADATFEKFMAPEYGRAKEAGEIDGWGYYKHHTGGPWRRITFHTGPTVLDVLNAVETMGERLDDKLTSRNNNYGRACHSHDDYIWERKFGNAGERSGKVAFSVYFVCEMGKESRVDELVEKEFGPAYDAHIGPGMLTSWGWLTHVVGGKYRRLLTTSAANIEDLLNTRAKLLGDFAGSSAGREFTSICGSHADYIWTIAMDGR